MMPRNSASDETLPSLISAVSLPTDPSACWMPAAAACMIVGALSTTLAISSHCTLPLASACPSCISA